MSQTPQQPGQGPTDPPGTVSDQNREEAEAGHSAPGGRGTGDAERRAENSPRKKEDRAQDSGGDPGSATEESQATGHPENAG